MVKAFFKEKTLGNVTYQSKITEFSDKTSCQNNNVSIEKKVSIEGF